MPQRVASTPDLVRGPRRWRRAALALATVLAVATLPTSAGADVIGVEAVVTSALPPGTPWSIGQLNDGDYAVGSYEIGVTSYSLAWGNDVGVVLPSDLAVAPDVAARMSFSRVNEHGLAGGLITAPNPSEARLFVADLRTKAVELLDTGTAIAGWIEDIGADGTVVGTVFDDPGGNPSHAVAWVGASHTLVHPEDLDNGSRIADVNAHGLAAGWFVDDLGNRHPATWDLAAGTAVRDLAPITGFFAGGNRIEVSDRGDVLIGLGSPGSSEYNDVVVLGGTDQLVRLYPIGTGMWTELNDRGQAAYAIVNGNDLPNVVVVVDLVTGARTELVHIPWLAFDFNDRGQVAANVLGLDRFVLWDPIHGWVDLGDAGGRGVQFNSMNSVGHLVGTYVDTRTPWLGTVQFGPGPPQALAATSTDGAVDLTWAPPVSLGDAALSGYRVSRDGAFVADVAAGTTSFHDVAVVAGTTVSYTVTAVTEFGESSPTPAVEVLVVAAPSPPDPLVIEPRFTG